MASSPVFCPAGMICAAKDLNRSAAMSAVFGMERGERLDWNSLHHFKEKKGGQKDQCGGASGSF
jgi:hypothetical protein